MLWPPAVLRRDLRGKIFGERGNFLGAFAQRRQSDRKNVDAVIQVGAERSLPDHFLEVAMRGDDHARIHRDGLVSADALNFSLFQHAQQFGLHRERHVANFIQKKRAARGLLEFSDVARGRAGERTFFVAEEFRLDQLSGHGGAIERHERPGMPRAFLVDRSRDQFLARAGLSLDRDARFAGRDALHLRHQPLHRRARTR